MDEQRVLRPGGCAVTVAAIALAGAVTIYAFADAADKGIAGQIKQVQQEVGRAVPEDRQPEIETRLARASAAAGAGRAYLALYELESAFETTKAFAFTRQYSRIKSAAEFAARWKSIGEPAPHAARQPGHAVPAVVEALAASAESRAPATYRASLPYAEDSNIGAGLYYLGESQAFRAFAAFARSLRWSAAGEAPVLRSIGAELDSLEAEVTTEYERMTPAQHPTYVLTSVTLKRARSLNEAGHFGGALLEYLLARYRFATLRPGVVAEPPEASRVAGERARLDGGVDHSIARLFVEMAEAALAHENAGVRRTAALLVNDVLPAYHAAIGAGLAGAKSPGLPDAAVTITLVRWPFT